MLVFIRALSGGVIPLNVHSHETVHSVKYKLFQLKGIPVSQQHILFDGEELADSTLLSKANISHGSLLRLILKMHAAPLNCLVSNASNACVPEKSSPSYLQTAQYSPVLIPVGLPTRNWNPVVPKMTSSEHKRRTSCSGYSTSPCIASQTEDDFDLQKEEICQLAELLEYAIDRRQSSNEETEVRVSPDWSHPLPDRQECNTVYPNFNNPLYALYQLPTNEGLIPVLSYFPSLQSEAQHVHPNTESTPAERNQNAIGPQWCYPVDTLKNLQLLVPNTIIPLSGATSKGSPSASASMTISTKDHTVRETMLTSTNQEPLSTNDPGVIFQCNLNRSNPHSDIIHPINLAGLPPSQEHFSTIYNNIDSSDIHSAVSIQKESHTDVDTNLPSQSQPTSLAPVDKNNHMNSLSSNKNAHPVSEYRCSFCHKRTKPATGFTCWCTRWYCIKHYHPEDHACQYNFKNLKLSTNERHNETT